MMEVLLLSASLSAGAIVAHAKELDSKIEDLAARARMSIVSENSTKERVFDIVMRREGVQYRAVVSIVEPAEMAGTRFLIVAERGKRNRQWAYFPDLDLTRSMAGAEQDEPFLGSDITYADLAGGAHLDDLVHRLLGEETIDGVACYVMEGVPRHPIVYGKLRGWVRKDNFVTVRALFFDRQGRSLKEAFLQEIRDVGFVPLAHRIEMRNLLLDRRTTLILERVQINQGLSPEHFTETAFGRSRLDGSQ